MKRIKSIGKDIFYFCKEEKRVNRSSTMWIRKRPESSCQPYFEQYNNQDMSSIVHVLFNISPSFITHYQPYQINFFWKLSTPRSVINLSPPFYPSKKTSHQAQCFQRQSIIVVKMIKPEFFRKIYFNFSLGLVHKYIRYNCEIQVFIYNLSPFDDGHGCLCMLNTCGMHQLSCLSKDLAPTFILSMHATMPITCLS